MTLSRRTTLKGLGLLMAGGGTEALRSAARDVDISRDVTVEFVRDDAAHLEIGPGLRDTEYIDYDNDPEEGVSVSIRHVNQGAVTEIDDLLEFTNHSANEITAINARVDDRSRGATVSAAGNVDSIRSGRAARGLSLRIDTTGESDSTIDATVHISVETDA